MSLCWALCGQVITIPVVSANEKGSSIIYFPVMLASTKFSSPSNVTKPITGNHVLKGIYGKVTDEGISAPNVEVQLMTTIDDREWTLIDSVRTDERGYYSFADAPDLPQQRKYAVHYINYGDETRLSFWVTHKLKTYALGSSVFMGSFDIGNIYLESPAEGAQVRLPATFRWRSRTGTGGETYRLSIITYPEGDITDYLGPSVSANDFRLQLNDLPLHYIPGYTYGWEIWVTESANAHTAPYEEGRGFGVSYETRPIMFANVPQP
jgi:hypothetical protein